MSAPAERLVDGPPRAVLAATLWISPQGFGPTRAIDGEGAWRATWTTAGAATVRFAPADGGVRVTAWGPGAEAILDEAPAWLGAHDDPSGFDPESPLLRDLSRRYAGLRLGRVGRIWELLAPTVLEQKVPGAHAARSWASIVRAWGEPAPGPRELWLPPPPERIGALAYFHLHEHGVEKRRADTLIGAARHARRLEEAARMDFAAASARLQALPGIGPWTSAKVLGPALGDPDAVPIGDYNLPSFVAWNLAGERAADDARMIDLLAPWAGHRARVLRLLDLGGTRPERRGPRMDVGDIRGR